MKIIDREAFLQMPKGTVFSEYEPCIFTGLFVKNNNPDPKFDDYFEQQLIGNVECNDSGAFVEALDTAQSSGTSFSLDFDVSGRNGMFDNDQLYAVYEQEDIESFIAVLQKVLETER